MTQENISVLGNAFARVYEDEYSNIIENEDASFSKAFQKDMSKLIKHLDSPWTYSSVRKKRLLIILVAAILLFAAMMSVSAFKDSFVGFIVKAFDEYAVILPGIGNRAYSTDEENIEREYHATYIPDGYTLSNYFDGIAIISSKYSTSSGDIIKISQYVNNVAIYIDNKDVDYKTMRVGDIYVTIGEKSNFQICEYVYDNYTFEIICRSSIDTEEIKKIVMGMQPVDDSE